MNSTIETSTIGRDSFRASMNILKIFTFLGLAIIWVSNAMNFRSSHAFNAVSTAYATSSNSNSYRVKNIPPGTIIKAGKVCTLELTNQYPSTPNFNLGADYAEIYESSENNYQLEFYDPETRKEFSWTNERDRPLLAHRGRTYYVKCKWHPKGGLVLDVRRNM